MPMPPPTRTPPSKFEVTLEPLDVMGDACAVSAKASPRPATRATGRTRWRMLMATPCVPVGLAHPGYQGACRMASARNEFPYTLQIQDLRPLRPTLAQRRSAPGLGHGARPARTPS